MCTECRCRIHPFLTEGNRLRALLTVGGVRTMLAVHSDVGNHCMGSPNRRSELLEVFGIGRWEMSRPRLDLIDPELGDHMRCKIFQLDFARRGLPRFLNKVAEGIGGHRNPLSRLRGKRQIRSPARRSRSKRTI